MSEAATSRRRTARPIRLVDIASRAGVSRWVVGQVLNGGHGNTRVSEETVGRIRAIACELGYRPNVGARLLRNKRSRSFGVMVASAGDPLRSFLVQYLDACAVKIGCQTLIGNTIGSEAVGPNQFSRCIEEFAYRGVDGVFCAVHAWFEGDRAELLQRHPNTVFYEDPGIKGATYVDVDRADAIRQATQHLIRSGRRRIGLTLMSLSTPTDQARLAGYRAALDAHGLPFHAELVFDGEPHRPIYAAHHAATHRWQFPHEKMDRVLDSLLAAQGVDAIIAYDDFWAASLIARLRRRGVRVPEDVAIVGYLNHYLADWTDPPLTSVDLRHDAAAQQMVDRLEQMIDGSLEIRHGQAVLIKPQLIVRGSA